MPEADIAGYSRLVAEDEEETLRRLASYRSVTDDFIAKSVVIALDDVFVVPVPTTLKVIGFFRASTDPAITSGARDDVARRIAAADTGWNAVTVGASGRPGLALKASNEQDAVNDALGNCVKQDRDCHVIAIGPFLVGPR